MPDEIDRARVEELAARLLEQLRPELARFPPSRENVWVALNALAGAAATVLSATDRDARRFFDQAVRDNIAELRREAAGLPPIGGPEHG